MKKQENRLQQQFRFPRHGESMERYMRDLGCFAELEEVEVGRLFERVSGGDKDAWEELVLGHLRLVVRIACLYTGYGLPLADMVAEGNVGLMRAVELYDVRRGVAFGTYASVWIRQRIHRAITAQAKVVRIPVWRSQRLRKLDRLHEELAVELGRDATLCELAERLGMDEEEVAAMEWDRTRVESIDGEGECGRLLEAGGWLADERLSRQELEEEIYACLAELDDHELQVLSLKFGLLDEEPVSYREMAPRLGRNREWIRKVGERALSKVRVSLQVMGSIPRRLVKGKRMETEQRLERMQVEGREKSSPETLSLRHSVLIPWMDTLITIL